MAADRPHTDPGSPGIEPQVPTSTAELSSSFVIRARDLRPLGAAPRRYPANDASFSSAAGLARRPWLDRLRRALSEEKFVLHYQPIVSLQPRRICGPRATYYEALIRLADEPDGRLVSPSEFLPAAERYGLIREIDRMVVAKVSRLLGEELPGLYDSAIALNLSAVSVTDPGMLAYIERQLARHDVDPARLIVEITETSAISDMRVARTFCQGLHALGSAVALDDFGSGFGSFQYLKQLPFDYLKIDGEFIRALPISVEDQLLVQALVGVARGLGKQTVAEYVADDCTLALLCEYGVDYAQGFGLGRPVSRVEAFAPAF
jgi:EAL domain-containing protein (putative c-di-GMP-specific phosphodiesterase class I)